MIKNLEFFSVSLDISDHSFGLRLQPPIFLGQALNVFVHFLQVLVLPGANV